MQQGKQDRMQEESQKVTSVHEVARYSKTDIRDNIK
jgi:hypothetical protein